MRRFCVNPVAEAPRAFFMGSEETFKAEENIQATLMINRINAPNLNRIRHAFLQNTMGSLAQSIKMYAVKMEVQNIRP